MTKPDVLTKKGKLSKKAWVNPEECVACGVCVKRCPKNAITIYKGSYASVQNELCAGCGICARSCPACIIEMK